VVGSGSCQAECGGPPLVLGRTGRASFLRETSCTQDSYRRRMNGEELNGEEMNGSGSKPLRTFRSATRNLCRTCASYSPAHQKHPASQSRQKATDGWSKAILSRWQLRATATSSIWRRRNSASAFAATRRRITLSANLCHPAHHLSLRRHQAHHHSLRRHQASPSRSQSDLTALRLRHASRAVKLSTFQSAFQASTFRVTRAASAASTKGVVRHSAARRSSPSQRRQEAASSAA
jgi:hypothetical protein